MAYTGDLGFDYGDYSVNPGGFTYPTGDFSGGFSMGDLGVNYEDYNVNNPFAKAQSGGGFFNQFGQFVDKAGKLIPQIGRIAGAVREFTNPQDDSGIFNPRLQEETTKKIDTRSVETFDKIGQVFKDIAGITGVSTKDAVDYYKKAFDLEINKIGTQGRADLEKDPDISKQYATLGFRIAKDRELNSLLNNERYRFAYTRPDAVAPVDTDAIKNVMTLGPAYKEQYSYEDQAGDIYGRRNAIGNIASFYANDPNLNQYMVSATDPNIQNLMNYS
jgi:hypothetical protein